MRKVFLKSRIKSWSSLVHSHDSHSFLYSLDFIISVPNVISGRVLPVTFKIVEFSLRSSRNGRPDKGLGANKEKGSDIKNLHDFFLFGLLPGYSDTILVVVPILYCRGSSKAPWELKSIFGWHYCTLANWFNYF